MKTIKIAKDCTEKKEIIYSQKHETLIMEKSTLVWRGTLLNHHLFGLLRKQMFKDQTKFDLQMV
jgi:hypothetical protein